MSSIMRRRNELFASSVMGMLLSLGEGCEPLISRQDAPLRYPLGCVACRSALPRERFSPMVESRCGAVALGRTYLLPPLSSGGASMVPPWLRFHIPLIEPDRQISRIRLVWGFHCQGGVTPFWSSFAFHSFVRPAPRAFFRPDRI